MDLKQGFIEAGKVEPGTVVFFQSHTLIVLDRNCGTGGMAVLKKYLADCVWAVNLNKNAPWVLNKEDKVFVLGKIPPEPFPKELSFKLL